MTRHEEHSTDVHLAPEEQPPDSKQLAWFHLRLRTLLILPAAMLILGIVFVPRQLAHHRALVGLRKLNGIVRTEPVALPGVSTVFGDDYAQQVREIYLRNPDVTDDDLQILDGLKGLQKLELSNAGISDAGLVHLSNLPDLFILHLSDTKVGDAGLESLQSLHSLGILSLNDTPVTGKGMVHLQRLPALERLFLNQTGVDDDGLRAIGQIHSLKELTLNNSQVTDAGLQHLQSLSNLEILKLADTSVTEEAVSALRSALPACYIEGAELVENGPGI
ncbi:hypothetical protein [Fuerstiella marisgermanici]|nr:hypothetical protein [Fuerstiella marisgermanici]